MSMTELEKIEMSAKINSEQKSLELLFDYTKFHIGVYLTLTSAYIAAYKVRLDGLSIFELNLFFVSLAIICFMIAGLSGGVIVSSITQTTERSSQSFLQQSIGPWNGPLFHFKALVWTWIEHTAFWLGLICAAISFFVPNCL